MPRPTTAGTARAAGAAGTADAAREELEYYTYLWEATDRREDAAFAIVTTFAPDGTRVTRTQRSFRPYATRSTDPKTEEHGH